MPHKDKKEHSAYCKKYFNDNPAQKEKNKQRVRFNYWKNKILDYYFRHKIERYSLKRKEISLFFLIRTTIRTFGKSAFNSIRF